MPRGVREADPQTRKTKFGPTLYVFYNESRKPVVALISHKVLNVVFRTNFSIIPRTHNVVNLYLSTYNGRFLFKLTTPNSTICCVSFGSHLLQWSLRTVNTCF